MADTVTGEQRRWNMSQIKGKNTRPELAVRRLVHAAGFRYRLHGCTAGTVLPGKPDLVFAGRRKLIFVNGCFWHSHNCRAGQATPGTNAEFWARKRERTVERDALQLDQLSGLGWSVRVVWECELKDLPALEQSLRRFLADPD